MGLMLVSGLILVGRRILVVLLCRGSRRPMQGMLLVVVLGTCSQVLVIIRLMLLEERLVLRFIGTSFDGNMMDDS